MGIDSHNSTVNAAPGDPTPALPPRCCVCRDKWRWCILLLVVVGVMVHNGATRTPTGPASGVALVGDASPATRPTFRVGTYNIQGGVGKDGKLDLDRIAANLRDLDIVGLNEIHGGLAGGDDQARSLGAKLKMNHLFAPTERRWWHDDFGNGVLSRLAVSHWARFPLAGTPGRGMRNIVLVKIPLKGAVLNVLITHMDRQTDGPAQRRLAAELFLSLSEPAILMGDFNADAGDEQIARLIKTPGVVDAIGTAMPDKAPPHIDWIFARGLKCAEAGFRDNGASDHPAVWAEFVLP